MSTSTMSCMRNDMKLDRPDLPTVEVVKSTYQQSKAELEAALLGRIQRDMHS